MAIMELELPKPTYHGVAVSQLPRNPGCTPFWDSFGVEKSLALAGIGCVYALDTCHKDRPFRV